MSVFSTDRDSTSEQADAATATPAGNWQQMPEIDLRQLLRMSDDTGIFQHAVYSMPDPNHGYCIDDNCRALIAALLHARLRGYDERVVPLHRYLTFLAYAFNEDNGVFRNFMGYNRDWLEAEGSTDSQGRTLWALGLAVSMAPTESVRELAGNLFRKALAAVEGFTYIRSQAFALIGLIEYLKVDSEHAFAIKLRDQFAANLFKAWQDHATDDWPWWEDMVTYDNAKLCHALLVAGHAMGRNDMVEAGLKSLDWLLKVQTAPQGHLSIIGNDGWLARGKDKAQFDQQPLEAYAMVHGCLTAAKISGNEKWADHAWMCYEWFLGRNDLGISMYHPETGGCQDGLEEKGPNKNQGAESILAYLLSVLELHNYREGKLGRVKVTHTQKLGCAIVGGGPMATRCLAAMQQVADIEPIAVWNRDTKQSSELADKHGLKAADDLEAMLADPQIQMVHVTSAPSRHAENALKALAAGKHVLCEKTLATKLIDAQHLLDAATQRDLVLGVDFVMRYGPLFSGVGQVIESGVLGAVLRGTFINRADDSGLPPDHWFWDSETSGGIFVEHGVHLFDLIRGWLGDGHVLSAHQHKRPGHDTMIDQVACEISYGQQTSVGYYYGFHQSPHLAQQQLSLIFERGEVILTGWLPDEMQLHAVLSEAEIDQLTTMWPNAELTTLRRFEGDERNNQWRNVHEAVDRHVRLQVYNEVTPQQAYDNALAALLGDMVAAIHDRHHRPAVTGEDGRSALKTAMDADRIARQVTA